MDDPTPLSADNDEIGTAAPEPIAPRERYFNRELSWLAFNERVLEEASNSAHPLLERLRFLSISGNNLDEFFMVRVAGLKGQQLQDVEQRSVDGMTAGQQLAAIADRANVLMAQQQAVWLHLKDKLDAAGIHVLVELVDLEEAPVLEQPGAQPERRTLDDQLGAHGSHRQPSPPRRSRVVARGRPTTFE